MQTCQLAAKTILVQTKIFHKRTVPSNLLNVVASSAR